MKILLKSEQGINLEGFMKKNKDILEQNELRTFYVISANLDKNAVYKIGIAGSADGKSYPRLDSYLHQYGKHDSKNSCKGVKVHYIGTVAYGTDFVRWVFGPNGVPLFWRGDPDRCRAAVLSFAVDCRQCAHCFTTWRFWNVSWSPGR